MKIKLEPGCHEKREIPIYPLPLLELLDYPEPKRQQLLNPPEIIEEFVGKYAPETAWEMHRKLEPTRKSVQKSKWSVKKRANKLSKKSKKRLFISDRRKYRVIEVPKTSGKKPKVEKRWQLLCNHCDILFYARPTPKNSRYVVNHQCQPDGVRRQYIIGVKGRNCVLPHESACIHHVECFGDPDCH